MAKWGTLVRHCKRIYPLACQGDQTALADMRALIISRKNERYKKRWRAGLANQRKKKMKNKIKLLVSVALTSLVLMCGCAGRITPQTAAALTTLAVYEAGKDNAKLTTQMRRIQPPACHIATQQGVTVEDVVGVIDATVGLSPETKATVNIVLTILQTSIAPQGTNTVDASPYIKAVICDGWAGGLALLPVEGEIAGVGEAVRQNAPMKKLPGRFVLVK